MAYLTFHVRRLDTCGDEPSSTKRCGTGRQPTMLSLLAVGPILELPVLKLKAPNTADLLRRPATSETKVEASGRSSVQRSFVRVFSLCEPYGEMESYRMEEFNDYDSISTEHRCH